MHPAPSPELRELLANLELATDRQLAAVGGRVRRLAGSLSAFDSVWLDALVQARHISPFQANEIRAGRGAQLACGPHVAVNRWPTLGYAEVFEAEDVLLTVTTLETDPPEGMMERLAAVGIQTAVQTSGCFLPLVAHGVDGRRMWAAWERPRGISAVEWMLENGRLPPLVVLEIARRMLCGLCEWERHGEVHGDLHARSLFLGERGEVSLAFSGLRGVVRPQESPAGGSLPPFCYETLAPERVRNARPPNPGSELFACGCVWWHLLTGRPPIAGGNRDAKLQNAAAGQIPAVRRLAPDTPEVLANLIASCTALAPADRPRSFAEMARILGPPAERGERAIRQAMRRAERWVLPRPRTRSVRNRVLQPLVEVGAVAACLLLVVAAWRLMLPSSGTSQPPAMAQSAKPAPPAALQPPPAAAAPIIEQVAHAQPARDKTPADGSKPLLLPEGRTLRLASLAPVAGQRICGEHGGRVVVSLPVEGLAIEVEDLYFENIDFLAAAGAEAMLELRAPTATFRGCRFLGDDAAESPPIALRWRSAAADDWLPTDERLTLSSCAFHRVDTALDCTDRRAATVECSNILQTRSGCLVRCALAEGTKPLNVDLDRCTLRDTGAVVRITEMAPTESRLDRLRVVATDCVFQLKSGHALFELPVDFNEPDLARLKWLGSGSLCALDTPMAAVVERNGALAEAVDDSRLEIVGLARSTLAFAGDSLDEAASSELRRWVAARRSQAPPGISAGESAAPGDRAE